MADNQATSSPSELVRKYSQKLITISERVVDGTGGKAVHDLRVSSRRLQQALKAVPARNKRLRAILRKLSRVRKTVGTWRNCDVVLQLLMRRRRASRDESVRRAWDFVIEFVEKRRSVESRRARRKLAKLDLGSLVQELSKLNPQPVQASRTELLEGTDAAWRKWRNALDNAVAGTTTPASVHRFRIATKRLRYSIELAGASGIEGSEPLLTWLRGLQDMLGRWHDRRELNRITAEAIANPKLLLQETQAMAQLLAFIDDRKKRAAKDAALILQKARNAPEQEHLALWLSGTPAIQQAQSEVPASTEPSATPANASTNVTLH